MKPNNRLSQVMIGAATVYTPRRAPMPNYEHSHCIIMYVTWKRKTLFLEKAITIIKIWTLLGLLTFVVSILERFINSQWNCQCTIIGTEWWCRLLCEAIPALWSPSWPCSGPALACPRPSFVAGPRPGHSFPGGISHKGRVEGNSLPWSAGHVAFDAAQDMVCFLGFNEFLEIKWNYFIEWLCDLTQERS